METILRTRRLARGLTQIAVAEALGVDQGHYSRIERGDSVPGRLLARDLARYFDVTIEDVLYPPQTAVG